MKTIDSEKTLRDSLEESRLHAVFIFKHSTRCPISTAAHKEVTAFVAGSGDGAPPVYINYVVESRAQSNELATTLGIRHESPQLLLVSNGAVVWHTSHGGITEGAMSRACASLG